MSVTVYRINALLSTLLHSLPVGTNLALFHLLWTLLSGRLLITRGAVIPALALARLPDAAVRRAWAALAYGNWEIGPLVTSLEHQIRSEGVWRPHVHDGYRPVVGDLTGFFRPRLKGCVTSHYSSQAGKALPAIPMGLAVRVGSSGGQRLPVPCLVLRPDATDPSEASLQRTLLTRIAALLAEDEVFVGDGGFPVSQVREAQIARFVVRAPRNFTARRSTLPAYSGKGRPCEKGQIVRPLARTYRGKTIPATPPDHQETWREGDRLVCADFWYDLVESDGKPGDATFGCVAIHDPRYREPLLLVTNLVARPVPEAWHGNPPEGEPTVRPGVSGSGMRQLYRDRWPVEQMPLAAKQMLGAERSFVFGAETPRRLPEIALCAGALLMYEATRQPVMGTGFWDRRPQATIGRLRRVLSATDFADWQAIGLRFRQKASPTAHLPKGVLGHRRHKPHDRHEQDLRLAA
ncbi:MAG: hypothetical protein ACREKF_12890 [Candidatus Methylomirabilales bacterium]